MNSNIVRNLIAILLICCSLICLLAEYLTYKKMLTLIFIVIGIVALIISISFFIYNLETKKYNKK